MPPILRLYEDTLSGDGAFDAALPAMSRRIFVVHGAVTVAKRMLGDGEAWFGAGPPALTPGKAGVTCWRFELAPASGADGAARGRGVVSHQKMAVRLDILPAGDLLLWGGSGGFPPGGGG